MNQKLRIFIADDDLDDLYLIETAITEIEDTSIFKAYDGVELIDRLEETQSHELPHLIILDYNMPKMTGAQVLASLGTDRRYSSIPKVMFTTSSNPRYVEECMASGAVDYFIKPDDVKELKQFARQIIKIAKRPL